VRAWRIGLVGAGVLVIGVGTLVLLTDVAPGRYPGILAWLVAALIVHDGLLSPAVFVVTVLARRAGRVVPWGIVLLAQGALVVVALLTALVVPEILKQAIGSANPSILPLDYVRNLAGIVLGVVVVTAIGSVVYARVLSRREKDRPSTDQESASR
jgi:hypothetical protein